MADTDWSFLNSFEHRNRRAHGFQPFDIKGYSHQRTASDVDQMSRRHITGIAPALHEDLMCSGVQRLNRNLSVVGIRVRKSGEDDGFSARQNFRPNMIHFSLLDLCERLRRSSRGGYAPEVGEIHRRRWTAGKENDRVIATPSQCGEGTPNV